jgi:glutaredoxin-related protein
MIYKVYSKNDCPWCVKAKDLLNSLGIEYEELHYDKDFSKDDLRELIGPNLSLTVPQIFVQSRRIGGYEDLVEYVENHGMTGPN